MANARIDVNSKQTSLARLNTDGVSLRRLLADPSTGALQITTNTTGSVVPLTYAGTDDNGRITLFAVSEDDGETPVALQINSSGQLLVKVI